MHPDEAESSKTGIFVILRAVDYVLDSKHSACVVAYVLQGMECAVRAKTARPGGFNNIIESDVENVINYECDVSRRDSFCYCCCSSCTRNYCGYCGHSGVFPPKQQPKKPYEMRPYFN